ncbi:MAG: hypothetical protein ACI87W_003475 [Halieaceae bacterium]|jgi:hypothetical protein
MQWRGELGVGYQYDTNVSVDEVDISSGESDYAWITDFELGFKRALSEKTELSLNYDISQSSYEQFSRVDRQTQIIGADINRDINSSNVGVSTYYIDSKLDGEGFLEYLRVSPYVSGFLAKKWFARGAYVYSERSIDERPQRDAQTHTGEADLYFFHRGLRSYVNLGYRYRGEDAAAAELDFSAHSLKLRYIRRVELWGKRAKTELSLRYEIRDYRNTEPTIGEPREDDRLRWKLDFELPLSKRLTWQCYYSSGDYVSNLPRADFTQTIVGTRLQFAW